LAKKELIEMCLGFKSNHLTLIPKKKVAKITEKQFGSVDDAAMAIYEEFDTREGKEEPKNISSPSDCGLGLDDIDLFSQLDGLGDDDV
jgi:hypothetical protein